MTLNEVSINQLAAKKSANMEAALLDAGQKLVRKGVKEASKKKEQRRKGKSIDMYF